MRLPLPLLLVVLAALVGVPEARAQRPAPFERLDVRAGAALDVSRIGFFYDFWSTGEGVAASVSTPFYLGAAEVGGSVSRYRARGEAVPDFTALVTHVGWGLGGAAGPLDVYGGVRVGLHRMTFDEDTFEGVRNESELALGVVGRAQLGLGRGVGVFAEASWLKTYTSIRLRQTWVAAGVSARLDTPRWLRRVLE